MASIKLDAFEFKAPLSFDVSAFSILDEARGMIDATTSVWNAISAQARLEDANFENTIHLLAESENLRSERENYLRFFASTSSSQDLREASNTAISMLNDAETDIFSRRDLFAIVDHIMNEATRGSTSSLDEQSVHYLSKLRQHFLENGCSIQDDTLRADFVAKKKRSNDLARECKKNLADERTGLWLTRNELHGVSESLLSRLEEEEDAGRLWLPTKTPFSTPAMTDAVDGLTRKNIYYAVVNRVPQNISLFREMILLHDETARMLGWRNHFEFRTSQKMVKTPELVRRLLSEVRKALDPVAELSAKELMVLKRKETEARGKSAEDSKLFFWDKEYYQKQVEEKTRLSNAFVSEYFELNTTFQKLLDMYEHLLGVRLDPVDVEACRKSSQKLVWHDDVRMFSAWVTDNERLEFLAYAYFDFHPREGKYTHAGHYTLQRAYQRADGSWHHPCSCLVMNYMKPTEDKPTLLSLQNVRTLFHEMGHMYHSMLSRARYAGLHSVDRDFVETPSVMLEHFFWDPHIIRDVSHHYSHISPQMRQIWLSNLRNEQGADTTPQIQLQLSLEQATDLARANEKKQVYQTLNDLFFATYDMLVHSPNSHEELENIDLAELFNKTRVDIQHMEGGEAQGEGWGFGQGQTVFRGILGKNDAGYYSYILGRIFALNIFQAGFSNDLMNKENGRRYRDMVLCKGGSQPEMKTLTEYLGHEPSTGPFLDWLGVRSDSVIQTFC